jgi:hypothetical protein
VMLAGLAVQIAIVANQRPSLRRRSQKMLHMPPVGLLLEAA